MAKNKNVLKFDGDLSALVAKFASAFRGIGANVEKTLSRAFSSPGKELKQLETQLAGAKKRLDQLMTTKSGTPRKGMIGLNKKEQAEVAALRAQIKALQADYDQLAGSSKRAGKAAMESAADQDAAAEAAQAQIDEVTRAYQNFEKRLRSIKSNMKRGDLFGGELSKKGKNTLEAISAEYTDVVGNIMRAAAGQEELTNETKEWLGLVELADSKLAKASGVRPSQTSGRKATRQQLKENDPAKYYGDQVAFQSARIIQDAPFGILGMANNFPGLMQAAQGAKGAGATFGQAFMSGLKGPFAAMIGLNLVTSLMVGWPKLVKGFKWLKEQFGGLKDLSSEIRKNTIDAVGGQAKFSGGVTRAKQEFESAQGYLRALREEMEALEALAVTKPTGSAVGLALGATGEALSSADKAHVKRLKDDIAEQEAILRRAADNLASERGKVAYAMHADEQAVRDQFLRTQREALSQSLQAELKMREENGEDVATLAEQQARLQNRLLIESLRERGLAQVDQFKETQLTIFQVRAAALLRYANYLEDNEEAIITRARARGGKAVLHFRRMIEDMQSETESILGGARVQNFSAQRVESLLTESDSIRSARRELEDFEGTKAQREEMAAETDRRIAAIQRQGAWERSEIAREERANAVAQARSLSDIQLEIREKSLDAVRGVAARREKLGLDHARSVLEIAGRLADEEAKIGDERNEALIAQISELADVESRAFDARVARMEEEIALQRLRAQEAVAAKGVQIAAARELLAFERSVRASKGGSFMGIPLRAANMGDTLQQQLDRSGLLERQAVAAARAQYAEEEKARRDARLHETDLDEIVAAGEREAVLKQQLEDTITNIEEAALQERLDLQHQHEAAVSDLRTSTVQQTLNAFAGVARSTVQMWEQNRRTQLAAEGKTQQEINRIVQEEGKKRFRLYKSIAVAETVISTYAAAQKTAEATAKLGPVLQAAAVAAQLAQGFMRVQQIRATTIGGSSSGAGGSSGSGATLGAVATVGSGTSAPAARLGNLPDTSSKAALGNTAIGALTLEISRLRNDNASLLTALGDRPIEVVLESETQGAIVRQGQRIIDRRTR